MSDWGYCKECKWWQLEPDAQAGNTTMGLCIEEKLQGYNLRVSGASGCTLYQKGEQPRAKGSGEAPPSAKPQA